MIFKKWSIFCCMTIVIILSCDAKNIVNNSQDDENSLNQHSHYQEPDYCDKDKCKINNGCICCPGWGLSKNWFNGESCKQCNCGREFNCTFEGIFVSKTCICPGGYTEVNGACKADCKKNPCQNGGKCVVVKKTDLECKCEYPFTGEFCEKKLITNSTTTTQTTVSMTNSPTEISTMSSTIPESTVNSENQRSTTITAPDSTVNSETPKSTTGTTPESTMSTATPKNAVSDTTPESSVSSAIPKTTASATPESTVRSTFPELVTYSTMSNFTTYKIVTRFHNITVTPNTTQLDYCDKENCREEDNCNCCPGWGLVKPTWIFQKEYCKKCECGKEFNCTFDKKKSCDCPVGYSDVKGVCKELTSSAPTATQTRASTTNSPTEIRIVSSTTPESTVRSTTPKLLTDSTTSDFTTDKVETISDNTVTPNTIQPDPCQYNPCLNGGKCLSFNHSFYCICEDEFIGKRCEYIKPNPCTHNPCFNGGTCFVYNNSFRCACRDIFAGKRCEIDITGIFKWFKRPTSDRHLKIDVHIRSDSEPRFEPDLSQIE